MKHPFKHGARYVALALTGAGLFHLAAHGIHPERVPGGLGVHSRELVVEESRLTPTQWRDLIRKDGVKFLSTVTFLNGTTGSLQTFNVPSNWNNSNNKIETIGAGASGGAFVLTVSAAAVTGGGGGGYSAQPNVTLTPGGTCQYQLGTGGAAVTTTTAANGNDGGDTWFNGASLAASSCGAKGGSAGSSPGNSNTASGGAGGLAASGVGTTKNSGGRGGNLTGIASAASGGGGAAGPNGAGNNGGDVSGLVIAASAGGSGDAGSGGSGGSGGLPTASSGGAGAEFTDSLSNTAGAGGGGGGAEGGGASPGHGGNYGAGGGASNETTGASTTSGAGSQGLVVVTNFPGAAPFGVSVPTAVHVSLLPPPPGPTFGSKLQPYQPARIIPISGPAAQNPPFPGAYELSRGRQIDITWIPPPPGPYGNYADAQPYGRRLKNLPTTGDNPATHGLGRSQAPWSTFLAWDAVTWSAKHYPLPHGRAQFWESAKRSPPQSGPPPQPPPVSGPDGAFLFDNLLPRWIPPQYQPITVRNLVPPLSGPATPSKANLFSLFNAIVASQNLTFCDFDCYTITLFNGSVLRYTTADFDINLGGNLYTSQSVRIDQTASKAQAHWKVGLDVDTWTVVFMPRPTDIITGAAFPDQIGNVPWIQAAHSGYLDAADVQVDRAWFSAMPTWPMAAGGEVPTANRTIFAGKVAAVDCTDLVVVMTINDYRDLFSIQMPLHFYSAACRHTLFDRQCNADGTMTRDRFMQKGTVGNGSTTANLIPSGGLPNPGGSGTYTLGIVQMTSGQNNGFMRTVTNWDGTNLKLVTPFPFTVSPGDTFTASAGCDLQRTTCAAFGNSVNFGGEPFIPAPETVT